MQPSRQPSEQPSSQPTGQPTGAPSYTQYPSSPWTPVQSWNPKYIFPASMWISESLAVMAGTYGPGTTSSFGTLTISRDWGLSWSDQVTSQSDSAGELCSFNAGD